MVVVLLTTAFGVGGLLGGIAGGGLVLWATGAPAAWHDFSIANVLPLLATVTDSAAVLAALEAAA